MASAALQKRFIAEIAPLIQSESLKRGYKVCSAVIAQACLESGYGVSELAAKYHNYFGLKCGAYWKGKSVNMSTREEYTAGTLTAIRDNFRVYGDMAAGVAGYYDFISTKRYANLKTAATAQEYLERIKADGYATDSRYVSKNMNVVVKFDLTAWDVSQAAKTPEELARECLDGKWGNGAARKRALEQAGHDYAAVQKEVNRILRA